MLVAALVILRILWRLTHPAPSATPSSAPWQAVTASAVHASLYVLLVVLCVSGFIVWDYFDADMSVFGLITVPGIFTPTDDERLRSATWYVHAYAGWTIACLIILHVCAALWHQLVLRDRIMQRIL
jgi:cytochrome b561